MISRGPIIFLVVALVLFLGALGGGYVAHARYASAQQLTAPGWCCTAAKSTCSVSEGQDDCLAFGGSVFNWDQNSCNAICGHSKVKKSKAAKGVPKQ
ncbi:hypothetical protein EXS70_04575 [Candidatus Peribacteria bacterium]|nr:hypothetical protein [Candidatus Peribacteria bacterium]